MTSAPATAPVTREASAAHPAALPATSAAHTWVPIRGSRTWGLVILGLLALDAAAIGGAFVLAYLIRFGTGIPLLDTPDHNLVFYTSIAFWAVPAWLALFALYHLYDRRQLFTGIQEYTRAANACTAGLVAIVLVSFLDVTLTISRGWLLLTWVFAILLVASGRFGARRILRHLHRAGRLVVPTVIVGSNEEARALAEQFLADPGGGTRVLGFIDKEHAIGTPVVGDLTVLGNLGALEHLVREHGVREVIIAPTAMAREDLLHIFRRLGHSDQVELRLSSGLFEVLTTSVTVQERSGVPLLTPQRVRITGVDAFLKTSLDYALSAGALIALSPLLLVLGLLIKVDSPGPLLHRRRVVGRNGKLFDAFKLRTMIVDSERRQERQPIEFPDRRGSQKVKMDPRITRLGRFLRRTSLDELPQLLNVLRGEMSLVGPRMIAPEETRRYGKWGLNLLTVKPGITGPWQVRGRGELQYQERVRLSMHYIRNYSIWADVEIMLRTVGVVLKGTGAY
jgi:exopolysaccharide biosynthesis polyprenyl glycosylphosphotransferase